MSGWAEWCRRARERPLPRAALDDVARAEKFTPAEIEDAAKLIVARYTAMPAQRRAVYEMPKSAMRVCCEELVTLGVLDELLAAVALPAAVEHITGRAG